MSADNAITAERFARFMQRAVVDIGKQFTKPDDDWMPVMQAVPLTGEAFVVGFDPSMPKDMMANEVMPAVIEATGAKLLATVLSAWRTPEGLPPEEVRRVPPSQRSDRVEIVIVTVYSAHEVTASEAKIIRHKGRPPTLGKWERYDGTLSGRFIEPLQAALRDSSGQPNRALLDKLSGGS